MWEKISKILKGQIITSILYIAFGVCLVLMPVNMVNIICKFVFGILLILVGIYHILIYVAEKLSATIFDLFSGGILLVLGIFLFMNPQVVVKLLPTLLGTFILVDSIWTLKGSFRLKKRDQGTWKALLIGSLIFIALGIALIMNPFAAIKYTVMFAGGIFVVNGITDVIFWAMLKRGLKELKQDLEAVDTEGEFTEENQTGSEYEHEIQPEPAEPEPEYVPWSSRMEVRKESEEVKSSEDGNVIGDEADSPAESFQTPETSENPDESETEGEDSQSTDTFSDQESVHPDMNNASNVVSQATITDSDLSDTKDESLLSVFSRKRKSRKED